jgi:hypothetical protein
MVNVELVAVEVRRRFRQLTPLWQFVSVLIVSFVIGATSLLLFASRLHAAPHARNVGQALTGHYDLFVAVISTPNHFEERDIARRTWLQYRPAPPHRVRVAHRFFVGVWSDASAELRRRLEYEAAVHGDVVMLDSLDTYDRLPFKTIALMRWLAAHDGRQCTVDFMLKTDDDSYVRLDRLHAHLSSSPDPQHAYWGFFNYGATQTALPEDDTDLSKAKVQRAIKWSDPLFTGTYYPPYALGAGYALAMPLVSRVVAHYDRVYAPAGGPPSRMEDAATGIYLDEAPGRVSRVEVWWRSVPAIKSGSKTTLCEEQMVMRSHVHDLRLMLKWQANFDRCGLMCDCAANNATASSSSGKRSGKKPGNSATTAPTVWRPEDDLDYTVAQLKWIAKRKSLELDRLRARLGVPATPSA